MGVISILNRDAMLKNCKSAINELLKKFNKNDRIHVQFLIVVLAQYLYLLYCPDLFTDNDNGNYYVTANLLKMVIKDKRHANISSAVVKCRNLICHEYGSDYCIESIDALVSSWDKVEALISYVGLGSALSKLSNMSGGKDEV